MQYGRRYSAEGGAGVTFGSTVCVWGSTEGEPAPGIEPADPLLVRIRSMSMILTEGVRPAVFSVGAKARHRQLHRAMLGSDSRFSSPAGSNRRKGAEDAWCRSVHRASSKLVSSPRSLPRQPWCRRSEDPEVLSRRPVRLSLGRRRCKVHRGCKVHRRWLAWRITVKSWPRDS